MFVRRVFAFTVLCILLSIFAAGCRGTATVDSETPLPSLTPSQVPPTPTATPPPPRELKVCIGAEPDSLYPYGTLSASARSVLAAIYDGPIDTNAHGYQAVILQQLPSLANGGVFIFPVSVYVGDEVVDASGMPVTLNKGVKIRPSGCRSDACAITYDGTSQVQVDQMQVNFSLLPGLKWSDGEPLTAADSVYSYQLNANPATPGSKMLIERTKSYEAVDETTVQWWGKPGYIDPTYMINFWTPYPSHLWSKYSVDQLPEAEIASRTPVGWGAYMFEEWIPGDHMTLVKNPYYHRLAEGLPKFDILTIQFYADPDAAVNALEAGACDLLDPSVHLDGQVSRLLSADSGGSLQAYFSTSNVMERLDFGIRPASYDNGYLANVDRGDYFGDQRTRQAIAMCIDRQKIVDTVLYGLSAIPNSFLPAEDPYYNSSVPVYSFNPTAARQLLEQAGWRDVDGDASTPLQAWYVPGVLTGTSLTLNYFTTNAVQRMQVGAILEESLAQCSIKLNTQYLSNTDLYAPGPDGVLYGRRFDLAEYAMGIVGMQPPCEWYTSAQVPGAGNFWVGVNISGFSDPAFDLACSSARQSMPDEASYASAIREAQAIFADELPVLPLYWRIKIAAARPDMCNFDLDPSASSGLWNLENLDYGPGCGQ